MAERHARGRERAVARPPRRSWRRDRTAHATTQEAAPGSRVASEQKALAAEERTAIVRSLVIVLNIATYWLWLEPTGLGRPWLAAVVSVLAASYGVYDLMFHPVRRFPILLTSAWTTATDAILVTMWIAATGTFASPYYLLWYLSLVAVTFRYDWRAPLIAAGVYGTAYLLLVALEGQLTIQGAAVAMAIRVSYILLCGGLGSLLAHESARAFEARVEMDVKVHEAERFRALAEASGEALVVSADGVVLECNQAYCRIMGLPRHELVGRRLLDLVTPGSRDALSRHIADPAGPLELWRDGPDGRQLLRVEARPLEYLGRTVRFASIRDVTAERTTQESADRTAAQLRLAVEAGQVGTWDLDLATNDITRDARVDDLLGLTDATEPLPVSRFLACIDAGQRDAVAAQIDEAAAGTRLEAEFRVLPPDGAPRWIALHGQPRRDEAGAVVGLVGIARDATAARAAEEARMHAKETALGGKEREARDRLAAVFQSSIDGILTKDLDGRITGWNPACEAMFGYRAAEAIGRPSTMLVVPGQEQAEVSLLETIREGRPVLVREAERVRRDGSRLWVSISASPLRDSDGTVVGCAAITRDITSLRMLERQRELAREATARLAAVVDSSIDGILTKDLNGRITSWNAACERMFGYTAKEAIGRPITFLYPAGKEAEEESILARIRKGQPVRIREAERVRKDGSTFWVSVSASPLLDANGRIVGAASIKRDVTEERLIAREREEAKQRLQELARLQDVNRFKTQFINTAAHELRTPLLPLRMQLELLMTDEEHPPLPSQASAMEVMRRNLERLGGLVEDLLTAARSQAGRLQLDIAPTDLANVLGEAEQTFRTMASQRGIRLKVDCAPMPPLFADGKRIGQVVTNLLSNAFKFTPDGGEIGVRLLPEGSGARISISDSGNGIAQADIERLFHPFVQVHDANQVTQPGSGLGLYICKQIVELHGGAIGCESPGLGKGTTFWFTLPGVPFRPASDDSNEWNPAP